MLLEPACYLLEDTYTSSRCHYSTSYCFDYDSQSIIVSVHLAEGLCFIFRLSCAITVIQSANKIPIQPWNYENRMKKLSGFSRRFWKSVFLPTIWRQRGFREQAPHRALTHKPQSGTHEQGDPLCLFFFFSLHVIPVVQQIICRPSNFSFLVRGLPPPSRSTFLTDRTDVCSKTLHALFSLAKGAALCLKCVSRLKSTELCTLRALCSQMSWFIASNPTLLVGWLVCQQSYTKTT